MTIERRAIQVLGIVQGVGFRPFVHRLATSMNLGGAVGNDGAKVWCEVQGAPEDLDAFLNRLQQEAPPLARIDEVNSEVIPTQENTHFSIAASRSGQAETLPIPADVGSCTSCLAEVANSGDRRFGYGFTCCTDCGPRYTVVRELPYDRQSTALAGFAMCAHCQSEYDDPAGRRFHAQTNCCAECGPTLTISGLSRRLASDDDSATPLETAIRLLSDGAIVAVKGLGGYQLLCRADNSEAVGQLRSRKHRDEKPFAVLVASVEVAHHLAQVDELSSQALEGPEAPIVLMPRRGGSERKCVAEVAPGTGLLGLMLPPSALHVLIAEGVGAPLVCTSANRTGEPIMIDDGMAHAALATIADAVLSHDRRIERRADDSVGQVVAGRFQLLRRARGFAPRAVRLEGKGPPVLGVGAELKSTVCLATADQASVSVHLGDLENPAALAAFELAIADQLGLAGVVPQLVVHDLHPEYLSTKFASAQDMAPTLGVQHHHAHLVSCLVDNMEAGPAIGVTFDGLGWGADNSLWGGEFLLGDAAGYERMAHLGAVPMPGGAAAIRDPWRMAIAHLNSAFDELPDLPVVRRHQDSVGPVVALCERPETLQTSSIGRLFDAVAAICDVRDTVSYEGQAAIGLEQLGSAEGHATAYGTAIGVPGLGAVDQAELIRTIVADLEAGTPTSVVARRFHESVAQFIGLTCQTIRADSGVNAVALTGGVFQNRLLVELTVTQLEEAGFKTLRHSQVPPNDGGISLGQVVIGRAYLAR